MAAEFEVRRMEPRDLPALWKAAAAQNRRDGTSYPFPEVFEMDESRPRFGQLVENVPLALVTEAAGRPRMGHVFLRTIEVMSFGGGQGEMDFSAAHIPLALELLRRRGYQDVHAFVPRRRADARLETLLGVQGMRRIDDRLAHFFRML